MVAAWAIARASAVLTVRLKYVAAVAISPLELSVTKVVPDIRGF